MPVLEASVYFFIWQTWLVSCWMDPFFFNWSWTVGNICQSEMRRRSSVLKSTAAAVPFTSVNCLWFSNPWPLSHKRAALGVLSKTRRKVILQPPPSFTQPSCVCHFSFTSYIPRMLALLFPCVLPRTRWLHRMEQFGWWCLKEENRLLCWMLTKAAVTHEFTPHLISAESVERFDSHE